MQVVKNARISTNGWSLDYLTSSSQTFRAVDRVPASSSELSEVIKDHERTGLPLVIEGFHRHENWPTKMFTIEGFEEFSESRDISVRDVHSWTDKVMNFSDFVLQSRSIRPLAEEGETERLYGKDAECPHVWEKWLQDSKVLPSSVLSHDKEDEFRFRPASSRIETLMCYLGVGDTYTPCHKDLCASSGQNLMCYTEDNGSSFWFMTESSSAPGASKYFHELGQELDHENHVITLEQLKQAPFTVYILEQRLGDLVLVPPRSCHQVVNCGGITLKTSWSRMTLRGLSTAYHHELPIYRRVGRPETYRIKSTIYYALTSRTKELRLRCQLPRSSSGDSFPQELVNAINSSANDQMPGISDPELDTLAKDLVELLHLYDLILVEEKPGLGVKRSQQLGSSFNDDNRIVCDFCECDIFQSFFECGRCAGGSSSSLIVCPGCYSEGRSCRCEMMEPMQSRNFQTLIDTRKEAADVLQRFYGKTGGNDAHLRNRHDENHPRLFQAACLLLQARKANDNKRTTRSCSRISNHYDSHDVPFTWGLHCQQCHRSACFEHILKHFKMHSAEAIFLYDVDGTRIHYHQKHQASNTRYRSFDVERKQKEGSATEGLVSLAHITLQYYHCVPSNAKSLRCGWYDTVQEEGPIYFNRSMPEDIVNNQPRLTITIPAANKRRGQVYVDVPQAPYSIPRKRSDRGAKPYGEVHPSSEPRKASLSATQGPKALSPSQRRTVAQNDDSSTNFRQNLPTIRLTSSSSLTVVTGKMVPRNPQHAKGMQCEPLAPQKYLENKKLFYGQLHFKKKHCPQPDDSSAMILTLTPDVPDAGSTNPSSPPQGDSNHPPAQFVPPQEELANSARQLVEWIHDDDMLSQPEEINSTHLSSGPLDFRNK